MVMRGEKKESSDSFTPGPPGPVPAPPAPMIWQLVPLQFPEVSILTFPDPELTL